MSGRTKGNVTIHIDRDGVLVTADSPLNRRQNGLRFKKDSLRKMLQKDLDIPAVHDALPEVVEELDEYIDGGHLEIYSFRIPTNRFTPKDKRIKVAHLLKSSFEKDGWTVELEGVTEQDLKVLGSI